MPLFRKFRHYSTQKVVEAMVQEEEEGVRIVLRGAVFLLDPSAPQASRAAQVALPHCAAPSWARRSSATLLPKDGREGALLELTNQLDHIGYEPETRWVGAKDRQRWWGER